MALNRNDVAIRGPLETAVLFLVFNRPGATKRVFEKIRNVRPTRLYVAADGPRKERVGEFQLTEAVRDIATNVDWECDVRLKFNHENFGCKMAVSQAISWFFSMEFQGIILEDDCLPDESFFWFCETLLRRYQDDTRVWAINGTNFQHGQRRGEDSYYFSMYPHIWGWATWRRVWNFYDVEMLFWDSWRSSKSWKNYFKDPVIRHFWTEQFDRVRNGEIDTWDYQFAASTFFNNGIVATPNINLVTNIGFGDDATHTLNKNFPYANCKRFCLSELTHPRMIAVNECADKFDFDNLFGGSRCRGAKGIFFRIKGRMVRIARLVKEMIFFRSLGLKNTRRR